MATKQSGNEVRLAQNKLRAHRIREAINTVYDEYSTHGSMIDALTDMRHLCAMFGFNFADLNRIAEAHYNEEIDGSE